MEIYRRTFAEINFDHLTHNLRILQTAFPEASFLCPMIKANSYGHGDQQVGLFLEKRGVRHLGVCLLEEALLLRQAGVKSEILVFGGFDRIGAQQIIQHQLTPVVSTWEQLDFLESEASVAIGIHLKFDTGMNRLGFRPEEAQKLFERLWQNKKLRLHAILTHLLSGEDAKNENAHTASQLKKLDGVFQIFRALPIFCHALNSAGILNLMALKKDKARTDHPLLLHSWGLRPGLMLYGYNPLADKSICDLKPVMSLKSHVLTYRQVKVGETVSYGGTWQATRDSVIAVVPLGYGDGYHRLLSNQSKVLFAGQKVSVVGTVCMDYLMLDVTDVVKNKDLSEFKDQEVTLFGYSREGLLLSAEELAQGAKSITWEILTSVGQRVPRVYTGMGDNG